MAKLTFRRIADPSAEDSYYLEPVVGDCETGCRRRVPSTS